MTSTKKPSLGCSMLAVLGLFFAANADDPVYGFALVWLIIAVAIAGLFALARRGGTPTPARHSASGTVTICVGAPLMPVPSLRHAYLSMPDHCRAVLGL